MEVQPKWFSFIHVSNFTKDSSNWNLMHIMWLKSNSAMNKINERTINYAQNSCKFAIGRAWMQNSSLNNGIVIHTR